MFDDECASEMSGYEIATISLLSCLAFERLLYNIIPTKWQDEQIKKRFEISESNQRVKNIEEKVIRIESILSNPSVSAMHKSN